MAFIFRQASISAEVSTFVHQFGTREVRCLWDYRFWTRKKQRYEQFLIRVCIRSSAERSSRNYRAKYEMPRQNPLFSCIFIQNVFSETENPVINSNLCQKMNNFFYILIKLVVKNASFHKYQLMQVVSKMIQKRQVYLQNKCTRNKAINQAYVLRL